MRNLCKIWTRCNFRVVSKIRKEQGFFFSPNIFSFNFLDLGFRWKIFRWTYPSLILCSVESWDVELSWSVVTTLSVGISSYTWVWSEMLFLSQSIFPWILRSLLLIFFSAQDNRGVDRWFTDWLLKVEPYLSFLRRETHILISLELPGQSSKIFVLSISSENILAAIWSILDVWELGVQCMFRRKGV